MLTTMSSRTVRMSVCEAVTITILHLQGGQVYYIDAAAGHQMTTGGPSFCYFLTNHWSLPVSGKFFTRKCYW